ncbi:MAG: hypothetical protein RL386_2009 [Bacteroidota bacterium]|jgi:hypothetical protein
MLSVNPFFVKNLLPYLAAFLLLGGGVAALKWHNSKRSMDALYAERDFKITDVQRIGKIFLAHRDGAQTVLERQGDSWTFNGRWKARQDAVENLLDALARLQVQYKPAAAAVPEMVRSLATEGIKVEVYDRRQKLLKAYYIGGGSVDERGVFAILEGAEQPYVAHLDGWEGNPRFRYSLKGDDWRDRAIFSENPDRITSVSIEYPAQRNQSFRLAKQNGKFEVMPFFPITPKIQSPLRPAAPERFLSAFEVVAAEDFRNAYPQKDSIMQTIPFAVITVKNSTGKTAVAKLYPIFPEPSAPDTKTGALPERPEELERYFVAVGEGDFMLAQHRVIRKILWGYPFFFEMQTDQ